EVAVSTPIGLPEEMTPAEPSGVERRVFPRHPILQRCLVWPPGASGTEGWRCIAHNISTTGIGIGLPCPLQPGTVLRCEAWGLPGAPPLQARVVFAKRLGFLWLGGCELLRPLSPAELQAWLLGGLDWLPAN